MACGCNKRGVNSFMREEIIKTEHPGLLYTHFTDDSPLSIHVVKINPNHCRVIPVRALDNGIGRECLPTMARRNNALAAINGGYFIIGGSFDGKSKGLCKIGSRWFASPIHETSSLAWHDKDLRASISRLGVIWSLNIDGNNLPIDGINIPLESESAVLYSEALHRTTLSSQQTLELSIINNKVKAIRFTGNIEIPKNGWVYSIDKNHSLYKFPFKEGMLVSLTNRFAFLDEDFKDIEVSKEMKEFWNSSDFMMSGGPVLIQNGVETKDYDNDFLKQFIMYAPHPRSAVGVTKKGEWYFVVVEGRQSNKSKGISVQELAYFLKSLGCEHALNLDGGASVLMVVENNIVNTPLFNGIEAMDEQGQRRIADGFIAIKR